MAVNHTGEGQLKISTGIISIFKFMIILFEIFMRLNSRGLILKRLWTHGMLSCSCLAATVVGLARAFSARARPARKRRGQKVWINRCMSLHDAWVQIGQRSATIQPRMRSLCALVKLCFVGTGLEREMWFSKRIHRIMGNVNSLEITSPTCQASAHSYP